MREGNCILVAGTGPVESDGTTTPGDVTAKVECCFAVAIAAIEELGGRVGQDAVGAARPCRRERNLEIEAEAIVSEAE